MISRGLPNLHREAPALGAILLLLCAAVGFFWPADFFAGYLSAFIFWAQIAVGCLGLLLLQYLTGGRWGAAITRFLEAGALTLPVLAVLFLPVFFGMPYLFPWIYPHTPELQRLVAGKAAYLNVPFYVIRYAIYFLILGSLAAWYRRLSLHGNAHDIAVAEKWSGPALIGFVLLMNFATIDWVMSLKPEWYSSMLSVEFCAEAATATMAWSIITLRVLDRNRLRRDLVDQKVTHDLGNLLLAFTCFWTYVTFSEFLIIWTGNLPHEVSWFADRSSNAWKAVAVALVFLHFVIPVFCLILTAISKRLDRLAWVAGLMLAAHFVQIVWWVGPGSQNGHFPWFTPFLVLGVGLIWSGFYVRFLQSAPLMLAEGTHSASPEVTA
ncbi:MAG TPA: hypothetical protein VL981_04025 [Candidatus Methylacidiphilales bacterium]|nr:hypothetical protein [Candidatus Methylacidiphilales bacterium]